MREYDKYCKTGIKVPYEELFVNSRYPEPEKLIFDSVVNGIRTGTEKRKWTKEYVCKILEIGPDVYDWYCLYLDDVKPEYY